MITAEQLLKRITSRRLVLRIFISRYPGGRADVEIRAFACNASTKSGNGLQVKYITAHDENEWDFMPVSLSQFPADRADWDAHLSSEVAFWSKEYSVWWVDKDVVAMLSDNSESLAPASLVDPEVIYHIGCLRGALHAIVNDTSATLTTEIPGDTSDRIPVSDINRRLLATIINRLDGLAASSIKYWRPLTQPT